MERPKPSQFGEIRRLLPLLAAALLVVALLFPMWHIRMDAVQYPSETLSLGLYAYPRISGDYVEIARLNSYIGFYYPDPVYWPPNYEPHPDAIDVPEWSLGPLAFVGVAAASLFVAVAPTARKLRRGLTAQLVGSVLVFGILLADIQYRLYQAGHTLDPDAPVMGVDPFTPPLWGKYAVANITSYSRFGVGAYLTVVAIGLLVVAWLARGSTATVGELPRLVRAVPDRLRERVGRTEVQR
ncbi:hypothetical protein [Halolamina sediminis]|jgi:hypothetical protein|uniref:hypothetical protein n=1 Tax=Halolamina sediminis TaxID=1480675 RepID=UPI0006B5367D|nr:hypothetical protein [Halolamina sediminis]